MKRVLVFLTLFAITLISLTSCILSPTGDNQDDQNSTFVFYGAVTHLSELNNTCVYLANTGHMAMPSVKEGSVPHYDVGDLVKLSFTVKGKDLAVMESFPGQFGQAADEVIIKDANSEIGYDNGKWQYGETIPQGLSLNVDDSIAYMTSLGEYCQGRIVSVNNGRYLAELDIEQEKMNDFLRELFESGLDIVVK